MNPETADSRSRPVDAFVGLGSNLGDRASALARAIRRLGELGEVAATSGVYETEPWGVDEPQPPYLNQVCLLRTTLPAVELMQRLLEIERRMGRGEHRKNAPRVLDLDLVLYGDRVLDEPGLTVPHPRMHQRAFVLAPLAELAPDLVHPALGETIAALARRVGAEGVTRLQQ